MKAIEEKIIKLTQSGLPVTEQPLLGISEELGISEKQLIIQLEKMKNKGLIRRIGLVPNHYALGYVYNLMTVWDIKDSEIGRVGEMVGGLESVSHCYQRPRHLPDWPYNFFAMVHGKNELQVMNKVAEIERLLKSSCQQFVLLRSTKILKKTGLRI